MIIFLYGEDTYRRKEKEKEIVFAYGKKHKSGINLRKFDCSKDSFSLREISLQSSQVSMFKEKKLYLFYNLFSKKEEIEKEIDKMEKSEDLFVFLEDKVDEKEKLFKRIKENSPCENFQLLMGVNLKNWIRREFKKFEKEIEEKEINYLISSFGNNLWLAHNEIEKIVNFSEGKKIKEEDVKVFLKEDIKNDIFKTIDAIGEKDKKKAIRLIRLHIEKGENILYILSMIAYQLKNILIIKDLLLKGEDYKSASKKSKMHPFVFRKTYNQSLKFNILELKKIYQEIVNVDLNIKTGKIEKETGLELFIAGV